MSMYECPKCGGVPGVTVCCSDAQTAQAGHVPEASCGECGKKASDGWALYCVACMEKAGLPAVTDSPPLTHSCTSSLGKTPDSTAQAVPLLSDAEIHNADPMPQNRFDQERVDFARAIESLVRSKLGAGVPMTHAERTAALVEQYPDNDCPHMWSFLDGIRAAERHHGIVGKEGGK